MIRVSTAGYVRLRSPTGGLAFLVWLMAGAVGGTLTASEDAVRPSKVLPILIVVPIDPNKDGIHTGKAVIAGRPAAQVSLLDQPNAKMVQPDRPPLVAIEAAGQPLSGPGVSRIAPARSDHEAWYQFSFFREPIQPDQMGELVVSLHNVGRLPVGAYRGSVRCLLREVDAGNAIPAEDVHLTVEITVVRIGRTLRGVRFVEGETKQGPLASASAFPPAAGVSFGRPVRLEAWIEEFDASNDLPPFGVGMKLLLDAGRDTSSASEATELARLSLEPDASTGQPRFRVPLDHGRDRFAELWRSVYFDPVALGLVPTSASGISGAPVLYNSRRSPKGQGPDFWNDPVVWLESSPELSGTATYPPVGPAQVQRKSRVWRVGFPAIDIRGELTAEAFLDAGMRSTTGAIEAATEAPVATASAAILPGIGFFPSCAVAGEPVSLVVTTDATSESLESPVSIKGDRDPVVVLAEAVPAIRGRGHRFVWPSKWDDPACRFKSGTWIATIGDRPDAPTARLFVGLEFPRSPRPMLAFSDGGLPWWYGFPGKGRASLGAVAIQYATPDLVIPTSHDGTRQENALSVRMVAGVNSGTTLFPVPPVAVRTQADTLPLQNRPKQTFSGIGFPDVSLRQRQGGPVPIGPAKLSGLSTSEEFDIAVTTATEVSPEVAVPLVDPGTGGPPPSPQPRPAEGERLRSTGKVTVAFPFISVADFDSGRQARFVFKPMVLRLETSAGYVWYDLFAVGLLLLCAAIVSVLVYVFVLRPPLARLTTTIQRKLSEARDSQEAPSPVEPATERPEFNDSDPPPLK